MQTEGILATAELIIPKFEPSWLPHSGVVVLRTSERWNGGSVGPLRPTGPQLLQIELASKCDQARCWEPCLYTSRVDMMSVETSVELTKGPFCAGIPPHLLTLSWSPAESGPSDMLLKGFIEVQPSWKFNLKSSQIRVLFEKVRFVCRVVLGLRWMEQQRQHVSNPSIHPPIHKY